MLFTIYCGENPKALFFTCCGLPLVGLATLRIVGTKIELSLLLDVELALERFV